MKFFSKCPLFCLLVISALLLSALGFAERNGVYQVYADAAAGKPAVASVFWGLKDGIFPWSGLMEAGLEEAPDGTGTDVQDGFAGDGQDGAEGLPEGGTAAEESPETAGNGQDGETAAMDGASVSQNGWAGDQTDPGAQSLSGNGLPGDGGQLPDESGMPAGAEGFAGGQPAEGDGRWEGGSVSENGIGPAEEETTYDFERVEEDYFSDALFIGDSRTQGMLEYGGLEDKATFYCKTSLTVYDLFQKEKAFIKEDGESLTLTQALERHTFGKIYLMIGINEMGTGTPESFFEAYAMAVYRIRQLQPDAIIFLQGIMRVAGDKSASDPIFNNENINLRNAMIQTLADQQTIFYVEVNEAVCDENGNLHADWTFDQIHLKAKYYQVWKEYLMEHGIVVK